MFVDHKGLERWRCWSDGHAGTAIDAVMIGHNLDVTGALRWLQERAGNFPQAPTRQPTPTTARPLSSALHAWANDCEHRLWRPEGRTHAPGSTSAASTTTSSRPTGSGSTRIPRRARPRGLPRWRGVTVCSFDRAGTLAYVQVRNLDGQAPSKYSNPTHNTALPAVTFPWHPPAVPSSSPKASSTASSSPRPATGPRRSSRPHRSHRRRARRQPTRSAPTPTVNRSCSPSTATQPAAPPPPDSPPTRRHPLRVLHILDHEDLTSSTPAGRTSHG